MNELKKLVFDCEKAIRQLASHVEHYKIDFPIEINLDQIREWFLVMEGYVLCLEKHKLAGQTTA